MVIADTCSLVYLSKYYLPFDKDDKLRNFFEKKFCSGELILLDAILTECTHQSQGLVVKSMPFLESDKISAVKTTDMLAPAPQRFSNQLDNNLCVTKAKTLLTKEAYALQKQLYLESGDGRIIVFALNKIKENELFDEIIVLTDETKISNDGKLFKKLPIVCELLNIRTITLVDYLKDNHIDVDWKLPS